MRNKRPFILYFECNKQVELSAGKHAPPLFNVDRDSLLFTYSGERAHELLRARRRRQKPRPAKLLAKIAEFLVRCAAKYKIYNLLHCKQK
jgi:hypothetical protein